MKCTWRQLIDSMLETIRLKVFKGKIIFLMFIVNVNVTEKTTTPLAAMEVGRWTSQMSHKSSLEMHTRKQEPEPSSHQLFTTTQRTCHIFIYCVWLLYHAGSVMLLFSYMLYHAGSVNVAHTCTKGIPGYGLIQGNSGQRHILEVLAQHGCLWIVIHFKFLTFEFAISNDCRNNIWANVLFCS